MKYDETVVIVTLSEKGKKTHFFLNKRTGSMFDTHCTQQKIDDKNGNCVVKNDTCCVSSADPYIATIVSYRLSSSNFGDQN